MLTIGQRAPRIVLPDADMETVDTCEFRGKQGVVVFFYPKDDTPNCTLEATDFSDHEEEFGRCGYAVLGVNCDDCMRHAEFRDKHGISIRLLSDEDGEVCRRYGVFHLKESDGAKHCCIRRSTFVIDRRGVVRLALYGVNARGHVLELLHAIKELDT
jgi:peroxiredoxin Q/BCP